MPVSHTATRQYSAVIVEVGESCPLPDDPVLAEWATAMGDWGWIVDSSWKLRFVTDEQRLSLAADLEMVPILIGEHLFGPEMTEMSTNWRTDLTQQHEAWGRFFVNAAGLIIADTGR